MKKLLTTLLFFLSANVSAAPSELTQMNSLSQAVIELQMINYSGPKADLSPNKSRSQTNNINSLGQAALAKHAAETQYLKTENTQNNRNTIKTESYYNSLYSAALHKHYKTAPK